MKNIMDLNQAEVAVTTQHLIDMGQEKDNLLQMSDFRRPRSRPLWAGRTCRRAFS